MSGLLRPLPGSTGSFITSWCTKHRGSCQLQAPCRPKTGVVLPSSYPHSRICHSLLVCSSRPGYRRRAHLRLLDNLASEHSIQCVILVLRLTASYLVVAHEHPTTMQPRYRLAGGGSTIASALPAFRLRLCRSCDSTNRPLGWLCDLQVKCVGQKGRDHASSSFLSNDHVSLALCQLLKIRKYIMVHQLQYIKWERLPHFGFHRRWQGLARNS